MYIGIGQTSAQHETCTFEICYFYFHYGSNLPFSGIQVTSMPNIAQSESVRKYDVRHVIHVAKKSISQIVHVLFLRLLLPNETQKP